MPLYWVRMKESSLNVDSLFSYKFCNAFCILWSITLDKYNAIDGLY